jgi:hypothetical protein
MRTRTLRKLDFIHSEVSAGGTLHAATRSARLAMVLAISMTSTIPALLTEQPPSLSVCCAAILVESKGVMVGEVGARDGGGLCVDLGVQALELARMTLKGARVGGDLGSVLVLHDAQFERVLLAHVGAGDGFVIKACVHAWLSLCVCGFGLVEPVLIDKYFHFATGLKINYSVQQQSSKSVNMTRACTWCRSCSISVEYVCTASTATVDM